MQWSCDGRQGKWYRGILSVFLVVCLSSVVWSARPSGASEGSDSNPSYQVHWGQQVPVRDGVNLNAILYLPTNANASPTILSITPYGSDLYHEDAIYFAQRGYNYVVVETRGRGSSEGEYEPFVRREAEDGYDVIDWCARQPWSNGKIAMRGGSYSGHNQWLTVTTAPPSLATIVPVASPYIGYDFPMRNNRPTVFALMWRVMTDGAGMHRNIGYDTKHWNTIVKNLYMNGKPYAALDKASGMPSELFKEWIEHPSWGPYWEARNPTDKHLAQVQLPILTITGFYDGDQKGALELYRRHVRNVPNEVSDLHYLVIGPWAHGGTRRPTAELGGYTFGEESVIDMKALDLAWYNWTMKDGDKPEFLQDRVAYFLAGANRWIYASSLEEIADSSKTLYLSSNGQAGDVFAGGALRENLPERMVGPDQFVFNPGELPQLESPMSRWNPKLLIDQSGAYRINGNGLVYTSDRFLDATEITGNVQFDVWIELDVPDADLAVYLYEVKADGSSVFLTWDTMRARFRNSLSDEELVTPGEIHRYSFNRFDFFSRLIAKGSRLRLVLVPPSSFDSQINFNGGGVVANETIHDARETTVKVHHGSRFPSALTIPIVRASHDDGHTNVRSP